MKITDSDIIKTGEQELIDAITADLDWGAIEEIFLKEHNLGIEEDIEYKSGDIVAVDNQIAYKLEFEVKVSLSVLLDRNGEYLSVTISNRNENQEEETDIDVNAESPIAETDTEDNMHVEESAPADDDNESSTEQNNAPEEPESEPFGDLSDNTDNMGRKVDDILENIKKAG
ncbi:MAG: hypothetical protein PVG39_23540 [Desulfobacteraceae bacterium]|jgi:hypothetical protein